MKDNVYATRVQDWHYSRRIVRSGQKLLTLRAV